jgi:hypothetical protein
MPHQPRADAVDIPIDRSVTDDGHVAANLLLRLPANLHFLIDRDELRTGAHQHNG